LPLGVSDGHVSALNPLCHITTVLPTKHLFGHATTMMSRPISPTRGRLFIGAVPRTLCSGQAFPLQGFTALSPGLGSTTELGVIDLIA
jgi:hypothetical protein